MARILSDDEIDRLLRERKPLPDNWETRLKLREKSDARFSQRELEVMGEDGHRFRIVLRQSSINPLDFSIILLFIDDDSSTYRLTRFNGRHPSPHTNRWEKRRKLANTTFRNRFHIHRATERYQMEGLDIDGYAEPTDSYGSFDAALESFVRTNGFELPAQEDDAPLFTQGTTADDDNGDRQ